jgi:hypothetical protein
MRVSGLGSRNPASGGELFCGPADTPVSNSGGSGCCHALSCLGLGSIPHLLSIKTDG